MSREAERDPRSVSHPACESKADCGASQHKMLCFQARFQIIATNNSQNDASDLPRCRKLHIPCNATWPTPTASLVSLDTQSHFWNSEMEEYLHNILDEHSLPKEYQNVYHNPSQLVVRCADVIIKVKSINKDKYVMNEYNILTHLQHIEFKLSPKPLHYGKSNEHCYIIIQYIDGESLYNIFMKQDSVKQIVEQLKNILHDIHNINPPKDYALKWDYDNFYKDNIIDNKHTELYKDVIERLFSTIERRLVFIHRDLWAGNILIKNNKIVGIIDWELA
ncbi:hypothetical protein GGI26_002818, partial [Coemansia sp. RSA 1358]